MSRTKEEIRENIKLLLIEEMNVINTITQGDPEKWVPIFIKNLTDKIHNLCMDEITFRKRF